MLWQPAASRGSYFYLFHKNVPLPVVICHIVSKPYTRAMGMPPRSGLAEVEEVRPISSAASGDGSRR